MRKAHVIAWTLTSASSRRRGASRPGRSCRHLGKQRAVIDDAIPAHLGIGRVELDQDGVAAEPVGDEAGRAGAAEWVEDGAVLGHPARMHGSISAGGKVAKWASVKGAVATSQTLRLLRSARSIAIAEAVACSVAIISAIPAVPLLVLTLGLP